MGDFACRGNHDAERRATKVVWRWESIHDPILEVDGK